MKLLFTGPLLDFSGFAHAARGLLLSLVESNQFDIVARPLRYDQLDEGQKFETPEWLQPLLEKDLQNVDIVIQMTTCNSEAVPIPGVLNGLYTFFETDRLQPSWASKAQEFDFIMVSSRANGSTLTRSGVTRPILVCAPPCDKEIYKRDYEPFEITVDNQSGRTVFYNICQLSTKKGIDALLRAYYAAFVSCPDEVLLVLKTYVNMSGRQNDINIVKEYVNMVKQKCRIPSQQLPPVLPLVYTMSDDEIHGLHKRGDAYVCSSRAEGWGIPVFDALAHGTTVISHKHGGLADFVSEENSLVYGGCMSLFYDMPYADPGLFTGLEQCFEPSVAELAMIMQRYHLLRKGAADGTLDEKNQEEWQSVLNRRINGLTIAERLDYHMTAEPIAEQIEAVYQSWKKDGVAKFQETS